VRAAAWPLILVVAWGAVFSPAQGQVFQPQMPPPVSKPAPGKAAEAPKIPRGDPPPPGIVVVRGSRQEREGEKYHLRVKSELESEEFLLQADEIDYDQETGIAEARGSVHFTNFQSGEQLWAERIDYNLKDGTGTFYKVRGSAYGKIDYRPGILTTGNPFVFQGNWAEKLKDRYILHNGTITNCDDAKPWWVLSAPTMDIIPNDRALAYKSWFKLRGVPMLYAPMFYKDLSSGARRSGFLTPNIGNSNRRGLMFGVGYFWAINRSYDVMYRPQYFTQRGLAHTVDFRGKPTQNSDFNAYVYGINDRGELQPDGTRVKQGGYLVSVQGKAALPMGFYARGTVNYLSNFLFRQTFTESFNEATASEANSVIYATKNWSMHHLTAVYTRQENFQDTTPGNTILIRKLPQLEFDSRDLEVNRKVLPVWVSWTTSVGLLHRREPQFQTRNSVERLDARPEVMTALRWKDVHLIPRFSVRETYYGSSFQNAPGTTTDTEVSGQNLNRMTAQFAADLILPSLERVFDAPKWMGQKVKHSIEPRASFKTVSGVKNFNDIIRFDERELLADTTEVEYSLTNRLWTKSRSGAVRDWLTWELRQKRFFEPDFGGAVVSGQRNVFETSADLSAYAFINEARRYSPIVNILRAQPLPAFGLEWRSDYDPLRSKFTNSSVSADARLSGYFFSFGHSRVSCIPLVPVDPSELSSFCLSPPASEVLSPPSNQIRGTVGLGDENRRGWNAAFYAVYDYSTGILQYANTQITYNTSCCAFSGQYRRFNFGSRNENQFRLAMVIANIGSFGTLKRQERLF